MIEGYAHVPRLRLLWADGSADQVERVRSLLSGTFELRIANDAQAALQLAQREAPSMACVVGSLSSRDGTPLLRALRALPGLHETTFLFSCPRGQEALYPGELACADDSLLTPFSDYELTTRLRLHARLAHARKEESVHEVFLAGMGHALRTPLTAIQLWAASLRGASVTPQELDQALSAISASAQSQGRRIDDLLDLSRLSLGNLSLERSTVSAEALLRDARVEFEAVAAAKHITLQLELAEPLGSIDVDPRRLRQVLSHLLANALKFTQAGGQVTLRARRSDRGLELEVADTGQGFDASAMPISRGIQRSDGELGIGLALSRQLIAMHGGSSEAYSAGPGRGASFRVHLPQSHALPADPRKSDRAARRRLRGRTVLLVEDHDETRAAMQFVLELAGARVLTAEHGQAALAMLAADGLHASASLIDVLVCDLGLPDMSGYELMGRLIKAFHSRKSSPPPACAVSAHARPADRQRAIRAGFDLHLAKPMSDDALIEAVDDLCQIAAAKPAAQLTT